MTATRSNRRQLLKKAGAFGALAALVSPSAALAQTTTGNPQSPEGAWSTTITLSTTGPFRGLMTFAPGGGVVDTEQIDLENGSTPGIGSWTSAGQNAFALNLFRLLVDTKGNLRYTVEISLAFQLSTDSNAFTGSGTFQGVDPTGAIAFSGTVKMQGIRIQ
jgi:hypothetical protein